MVLLNTFCDLVTLTKYAPQKERYRMDGWMDGEWMDTQGVSERGEG